MKKFVKYLVIIFIYSFIYSILNEYFSIYLFISGVIISIGVLFIVDRFLLKEKYISIFNFNFIKLIKYIAFLLIKIVSSGYKTGVITLLGKAHLETFSYETNLDNDFTINMLANSITLTPGTITVERNDNTLIVMQLCKKNYSYNTEDIIKFENMLQKI